MLPKIIITDIDGVWTDGGMYYDQTENEWKKFNTTDSAGVLFCRLLGIKTAIITGEMTKIVERRAQKLKVDYLFQGVKDKVVCAKELLDSLRFSWADVAYIGDDINDIMLLKAVGFSCCPANAPDYIKKTVNFVTTKKGGDGAYREFVEYILERNNLMGEVLNRYLQVENPTVKVFEQ